MLYREVPFLRMGFPFCIGIISGLFLRPDAALVIPLFFIIVSGFCFGRRFNKSLTNTVYGITLYISLFLAGLLLYANEKGRLSKLDQTTAVYHCTVTEYPEEKRSTFNLVLKIAGKVRNDLHIEPGIGSILVHLRKDDTSCDFIPGDILLIRIKALPIVNRGNPDEFDYRFYMENQGIRYFAIADRSDILTSVRPGHIKPRYRALILREKIISMYRNRGITGERLALVAAITLGQKNMLEPEQKQMFMKAGIMHIMAVSGLHAVILSLFIFNLLFFLKGRLNFLRIIITVIILWVFAFVTGLTPSVLRAALMFSFIQAGNLMNRNANSINSVIASGFILMAGKPSVIFDAGFLLSYSAVIFIICFYQDLYSKLGLRFWFADKIWQSAAVSLTAQAGTLPLTISLFNRFPTWFLLTNVVIVPLSSLMIIVGCVIPLVYPIRFISGWLASFLGFLTGATQFLTDKASTLPFASIENLGMKPLQTLILFITIFISMRFVLNRKSISVLFPVISLLILEVTGSIADFSRVTSNNLIVYNTTGQLSVGIRKGRTLNLFTDSAFIAPEVTRHAASSRLKVKLNILSEKQTCIKAFGKVILISNTLNNSLLREYRPDFIVLYGKYPHIGRSLQFEKPDGFLIVTGNVKSSFSFGGSGNSVAGPKLHLVSNSGAFIANL